MGQSTSTPQVFQYPVCAGDKIKIDLLFQVCFIEEDKLNKNVLQKCNTKLDRTGISILIEYVRNAHFVKEYNRAINQSINPLTLQIVGKGTDNIEVFTLDNDGKTFRLTFIATVSETPHIGRPRRDLQPVENITLDSLIKDTFDALYESASNEGFPNPKNRDLPKFIQINVKTPLLFIKPSGFENVFRICPKTKPVKMTDTKKAQKAQKERKKDKELNERFNRLVGKTGRKTTRNVRFEPTFGW